MITYYHRGELGDLLYAMSFLRHMGGGALLTAQHNEHGIDNVAALGPLTACQPYIEQFAALQNMPSDTINLRERIDSGGNERAPNIIRPYWEKAKLDFPKYAPWLENISPADVGESYSVVNITHRYRDTEHIWGQFMPAGKIIFLGLHHEFVSFDHHMRHRGYAGVMHRVSWIQTPDLLEAARYIKGALAFFGNASACLALAQGVGQPNIYTEVAQGTQNTCHFGHEHILNSKVPA